MLGALGQLMESEYTNPTELLGLNGEMDTELMGYLNALNPVQRAKAMSKIVKRHIPSQGSRAEFEKFFVELPKHIKEQLLQGKLRLADQLIYTIKPIKRVVDANVLHLLLVDADREAAWLAREAKQERAL